MGIGHWLLECLRIHNIGILCNAKEVLCFVFGSAVRLCAASRSLAVPFGAAIEPLFAWVFIKWRINVQTNSAQNEWYSAWSNAVAFEFAIASKVNLWEINRQDSTRITCTRKWPLQWRNIVRSPSRWVRFIQLKPELNAKEIKKMVVNFGFVQIMNWNWQQITWKKNKNKLSWMKN